MRSGTANVRIQFIPFINDIRDEKTLGVFRFARDRIKRINISTRTSH